MRSRAGFSRSFSYRPVPSPFQTADHRHPALQGRRHSGVATDASETTGTSHGEAQTPTHRQGAAHAPRPLPARLPFAPVARQRDPLTEWAISRGGMGEFTHQDFRDLMTGESSRIGVGGPRTGTERGGGGGGTGGGGAGVTTDPGSRSRSRQGSHSRSRQGSHSRTEPEEGDGSALPSMPNTPLGAGARQRRPSWDSSPEKRHPSRG